MSVPTSDQSNELLYALNEIATEEDVYDLGLYPQNRELNSKYKIAITEWFKKNFPEPSKT
jgi:hypothetical protein